MSTNFFAMSRNFPQLMVFLFSCFFSSSLAQEPVVLSPDSFSKKDSSVVYQEDTHVSNPASVAVAPMKYGLALSGGGAKGLVYIGLLRMIDSLQIHIDYLTGTSMGAVLGGLYASGLSGDSLKTIVLAADWRRIISNKQPYDRIHIREKDEYDVYLGEFPVKKGIPAFPISLVEGQYLTELLQKYTFPVRNINDFHNMPIPLELVASDIVNGGAVVMKNGSLPLSIRASLAIPAAFSPAIIDGMLLVDGGLDRNFPVEEVRKMGADYVIGGYSGTWMKSEEELESNPLGLINQSFTLLSKRDIDRQKGNVDLLIDYSLTPLKKYGISDFFKYAEIVAIGENEARKLLPQLLEIKRMQEEQGIEYSRKTPAPVSVHIDKVDIVDEKNGSFPETEIDFVKGVLGEDLQALDDERVLQQKTEQLISYNRYDKLFYTYVHDTALRQNILTFKIKRKPKGTFHTAFHYDTQEKASIILNYTYRDLLFDHSRLLAKVNISEHFKALLGYYTFLDHGGKFWMGGQVNYKVQTSNDLSLKVITDFFNNAEVNFYNSNLNASLSAGYCIDHSMEVRTSFEANFNRLWSPPSVYDHLPDTKKKARSIYLHGNLAFQLSFEQNSLNSKFFAIMGNHFMVKGKLFALNRYRLRKPNKENEGMTAVYTLLHPDSSYYPIKGDVLQLSVYEHVVLPLAKRFSIHGRLFYGLNIDLGKPFEQNFHFDSYLFLNQKFHLGGEANLDPNHRLVFTGLLNNAYPMNNITSLYLGVQYNPYNKMFVTPSVSLACDMASPIPFTEDSDWIFGYGIDVAYLSFMGPIKVSWSRNNIMSKNFFIIGLGYMF